MHKEQILNSNKTFVHWSFPRRASHFPTYVVSSLRVPTLGTGPSIQPSIHPRVGSRSLYCPWRRNRGGQCLSTRPQVESESREHTKMTHRVKKLSTSSAQSPQSHPGEWASPPSGWEERAEGQRCSELPTTRKRSFCHFPPARGISSLQQTDI